MKIIIFISLLFIGNMFSQTIIKGNVISFKDSYPIPGVSIYEIGTTNGTLTDYNGNFEIILKNEKGTLVFSYLGLLSEKIIVEKSDSLTITLKTDPQNLKNVVSFNCFPTPDIKKSSIFGIASSVNNNKYGIEFISKLDSIKNLHFNINFDIDYRLSNKNSFFNLIINRNLFWKDKIGIEIEKKSVKFKNINSDIYSFKPFIRLFKYGSRVSVGYSKRFLKGSLSQKNTSGLDFEIYKPLFKKHFFKLGTTYFDKNDLKYIAEYSLRINSKGIYFSTGYEKTTNWKEFKVAILKRFYY